MLLKRLFFIEIYMNCTSKITTSSKSTNMSKLPCLFPKSVSVSLTTCKLS